MVPEGRRGVGTFSPRNPNTTTPQRTSTPDHWLGVVTSESLRLLADQLDLPTAPCFLHPDTEVCEAAPQSMFGAALSILGT